MESVKKMFSDKTYPTCHGCILKSIPHLLFGGGWPLDYIKFLGAAEEEWLPLVTRRLTNSGGRLLPQPVGLALALLLQQPVAILILSKTSPMTTKSVCSVEERLLMIWWWCDVCATGWSSWQRMMLEVVVFYTCTTSSCTRLRYVDQAGGRKEGGFSRMLRCWCFFEVFTEALHEQQWAATPGMAPTFTNDARLLVMVEVRLLLLLKSELCLASFGGCCDDGTILLCGLKIDKKVKYY